MGNRNLSVGLFVIAALALGIVLTIWFTGQRGSEATARYHVLIDSDVSGLTLGGPVYFMGVQVGEVTKLAIIPGNPARVRVEIRVRESTPVDSGTWATLAAQGITGVSVINLSAESGDQEPLRQADEDSLPVIPYRDTGFSALLSSAPAVLDKIDQLLVNANALLSEDNRAVVSQALGDVQSLTSALAAQETELADLPGAVDETLAEIRGVAERLDALVRDAGPQADTAIGNLEAASSELFDLSERLNALVARNQADVDAFASAGLGEVPGLVRDAREAARALEKLVAELREEPSRALYRPRNDAVPVKE